MNINTISESEYEKIFTDIFKKYEQKLYNYIVRVLRSDDLAKDILQDVFLKIWDMREHLYKIENINAFLYKLTENRIYDVLRKAAYEKKTRQMLWNDLQYFSKNNTYDIVPKDYDLILEKAIEQLPAQRKKIYILAKREGLKQLHIAEQMQLSPNTVRNQLVEAYKQIGLYLKQNFTSLFFF